MQPSSARHPAGRKLALLLALVVFVLEASTGAGGRRGAPIAAILDVARPVAAQAMSGPSHVASPRLASHAQTATISASTSHREGRGAGHKAGAALTTEHLADAAGDSSHAALMDGAAARKTARGWPLDADQSSLRLADGLTREFPTRAPPSVL